MGKKNSHSHLAGRIECGQVMSLSPVAALPVMIMFVEEKLKLL
jgi:hypothetical protein